LQTGIEHKHIDTVLPLAEVIMCLGFFSVCLLEELLHHFLHPHKTEQLPEQKEMKQKMSKATAVTSFNDSEIIEKEELKGFDDDQESSESSKKAEKTKSAIRTFFIVSALSFHR
jgi:hypothetical protein